METIYSMLLKAKQEKSCSEAFLTELFLSIPKVVLIHSKKEMNQNAEKLKNSLYEYFDIFNLVHAYF